MNDNRKLDSITIKGFKSIKDIKDLRLGDRNILIGANGAGKSNFINFFKFLKSLYKQELAYYVNKSGGAENFLYFGSKISKELEFEVSFGKNRYQVILEPTQKEGFLFKKEVGIFEGVFFSSTQSHSLGTGHLESKLKDYATDKNILGYVDRAIKNWNVYHFHDTGISSSIKKRSSIQDNEILHEDGANLAAYLFRIKNEYPETYRGIVKTIKKIAPFLNDFQLRPIPADPKNIQLEWKAVGRDKIFNANSLSDGTLRFIRCAVKRLPSGLTFTHK
jgi:predicted ATPase